eukprot:1161918-Pelagomonas_calceolata.AAC.2
MHTHPGLSLIHADRNPASTVTGRITTCAHPGLLCQSMSMPELGDLAMRRAVRAARAHPGCVCQCQCQTQVMRAHSCMLKCMRSR